MNWLCGRLKWVLQKGYFLLAHSIKVYRTRFPCQILNIMCYSDEAWRSPTLSLADNSFVFSSADKNVFRLRTIVKSFSKFPPRTRFRLQTLEHVLHAQRIPGHCLLSGNMFCAFRYLCFSPELLYRGCFTYCFWISISVEKI